MFATLTNGHIDIIKLLLDNGADPNVCDEVSDNVISLDISCYGII
jgi:ankyrin repeat protein